MYIGSFPKWGVITSVYLKGKEAIRMPAKGLKDVKGLSNNIVI